MAAAYFNFGTWDPTVTGTKADIGSYYYLVTTGAIYLKTGAGDTAWTRQLSSGGAYLPEQWAQNNVAAAQTSVPLSAQVSTNFDTFKAIRAGSIVGIGTRLTEAVTNDQLDVEVTINGVGTGLKVTSTAGGNPSGGKSTQAAGVSPYVAGDLIGVFLDAGGAFTPVTTDLEAIVQVVESL